MFFFGLASEAELIRGVWLSLFFDCENSRFIMLLMGDERLLSLLLLMMLLMLLVLLLLLMLDIVACIKEADILLMLLSLLDNLLEAGFLLHPSLLNALSCSSFFMKRTTFFC